MTDAERQLALRSKAGDREAFAGLYDAYAERIHRYLYYRVQDRPTAEDLTSTVFMKALANVHRLDPEKGTVSAWLYTIARNALTDHFRSRRTTVDIEDVWDALAGGSDVARDAETAERLKDVDIHLQRLPAAQREIVILRLWDGLSYAEIAESTGKSEAACKMAYSRGINALRSAMPLSAFILLITAHLYV
jgi:RNA polymerase sigma-70 factor (ECF subfamily)